MPALNQAWIVQPHDALLKVADGIWSAAGTIAMPLGRFPRRMTVVVLASGEVAVWSAIPLDDDQMERLDALGPVTFLIVPNAGHRLDLPAWRARYPDARVIAPPGARAVVAEAALVDATDNIMGDPVVTLERVKGMTADEFAMVIARADGTTLVLNDVLASIRHPQGIGGQVMARVFGFGVDRPRVSRFVRAKYVADARVVAQQLRSWADLPDLKRVIVSHVDIVTDDPARALRKAADDLD